MRKQKEQKKWKGSRKKVFQNKGLNNNHFLFVHTQTQQMHHSSLLSLACLQTSMKFVGIIIHFTTFVAMLCQNTFLQKQRKNRHRKSIFSNFSPHFQTFRYMNWHESQEGSIVRSIFLSPISRSCVSREASKREEQEKAGGVGRL